MWPATSLHPAGPLLEAGSGAPASPQRQWRNAWIVLAIALALHVTDEALTGFLPVYNGIVTGLRARFAWVPLPTFTFAVWLGGLVLGVGLLLALSPLVARGYGWLRVISYALACLMTGNALGHVAASLLWRSLAPGALSSPILLAAAVRLFVATRRTRRAAGTGAPMRPGAAAGTAVPVDGSPAKA